MNVMLMLAVAAMADFGHESLGDSPLSFWGQSTLFCPIFLKMNLKKS